MAIFSPTGCEGGVFGDLERFTGDFEMRFEAKMISQGCF